MIQASLRAATLVLICALGGCQGQPGAIEPGDWRAWLDSPGGELPFGLELERDDAGWRARIVNGVERIEIERVVVEEGRIVLGIDHYDAVIEATTNEANELEGRWWKTNKFGAISELPFHATRGHSDRFTPLDADAAAADLAGRWAVNFAAEEDPAIALLESGDGVTVSGTFLTTTGDYRYLAGSFEGDRLRLSAFDGAHAFLFDARLLADGTLAGDFWSRESWHDSWTAVRDERAEIAPATEQVAWIDGVSLADLVYPDLDGNPRSLAEFGGKARILEVFGSWCPNCNDATQYLVELQRRYGDRGLQIVGLAFEMSGEFERDAAQVRSYRDYHGIEYPLLIAGNADKEQASAAFPAIERVKSFPTTIFLDANGAVHQVYSGFSGPATGDAHLILRAQFEGWIEELLGDE